ncbi:MAG: hypothetical protein C0459_15205 [Chitinophaga sp.]|nr:hypothetical protein [Chitinophaga sp.]
MPGRTFTATSSYRYGFNGKENDKDISAGGQDYGMRIYDSRIGKFLSVDPLRKEYPMLSVYQFASNSPIANIDWDGGESKYYTIEISNIHNGQGKLILSTTKVIEEKSKEPGIYAFGYKSNGNLGSGTLYSFCSSETRITNDGVEHIKISDLGNLYEASEDDKTYKQRRGGLYLVSKQGGYFNSNGDLSGKDAIPIPIDDLVGVLGGWSSDDGLRTQITDLVGLFKNLNKREKTLKILEIFKAMNELSSKIKEGKESTEELIKLMKDKFHEMAEEEKRKREKEKKTRLVNAGIVHCRIEHKNFPVDRKDSTLSAVEDTSGKPAKDTVPNH